MPSVKSLTRRFLVFGQPEIGREEIEAVQNVLWSRWLGTGKVVKQFEEAFSEYMGGGYSVAVSSCSIGLSIALRSVGLCRGSNVLTSPLTFCATVNSILNAGCNPIFMDVDKNGNMDGSKIKERHLRGNVYETIHGVVPVNYTGLSAEVKNQKVPVIEDAAHSFGGKSGYGNVTVFSFYPTKNITSGEGGMIWTKDKDLANECRILSNNGQSNGAWSRYSSGPIDNYQVVKPGFKGNMPDILASIGLVQLQRWKELQERRDEVWEVYEEAFGKKPSGHSHHLYTIQVKNRAKVRERLYERRIGTGIHYEALHLQPAYQYLGYKKGDFPVAEKIGEETLSLPVSATMDKDEAEYVVENVNEVLKELK